MPRNARPTKRPNSRPPRIPQRLPAPPMGQPPDSGPVMVDFEMLQKIIGRKEIENELLRQQIALLEQEIALLQPAPEEPAAKEPGGAPPE